MNPSFSTNIEKLSGSFVIPEEKRFVRKSSESIPQQCKLFGGSDAGKDLLPDAAQHDCFVAFN